MHTCYTLDTAFCKKNSILGWEDILVSFFEWIASFALRKAEVQKGENEREQHSTHRDSANTWKKRQNLALRFALQCTFTCTSHTDRTPPPIYKLEHTLASHTYVHTFYLSFLLHRQNFWRIKFTPKKHVNYDKIHSKLPNFCVITAKYTVNCQFFAFNL